jgi:type I restriction enzyme M protein
MTSKRNSEVDAYGFIKETLQSLGWNSKNPSRNPDGQLYTQQECQSHPEIKKWLGRETPENIVKITERKFWVIEAKKEHKGLTQALKEARDYADKINKSPAIAAPIVSAVAGNRTDGYLVESEYFNGSQWQKITLNQKKMSGLLSPMDCKAVVDAGSPNIKDIVIDEQLFLEKAEKVNEILHLGAINKNSRAKVMAALLLSLIDETPPNIDATPRGLIRDINSRVQNVLDKEGKIEFQDLIKITLPPSPDNHVKFKKALVDTIQELNILNIRSAMNSGADVLGKFYEVFLKYGNGAKEIGIVLTPRHVTKWVVEILDIRVSDYVYDPTCGTGGFLVAAFDYIKKDSSENQIAEFKQHHLFGIDQEPEVVALAIVNMIFRGDGKNNLVEGSCFQKLLVRKRVAQYTTGEFLRENGGKEEDRQIITRVLMNPPFALKNSDEMEYKFVDHALEQMVQGGILFSVLPVSVMTESGEERTWREKKLLGNHTLLGVVSFSPELFYPIGVHTLGVFVRKGVPHRPEQKVFWAKLSHDGFVKSKGKRLPSSTERNDLESVRTNLRAFVKNPDFDIQAVPEFIKLAPIDLSDPLLELVPEAYLDTRPVSYSELNVGIEQLVREQVALYVRYGEKVDKN